MEKLNEKLVSLKLRFLFGGNFVLKYDLKMKVLSMVHIKVAPRKQEKWLIIINILYIYIEHKKRSNEVIL